jgi:hypothetical protein
MEVHFEKLNESIFRNIVSAFLKFQDLNSTREQNRTPCSLPEKDDSFCLKNKNVE